MRSTLFYIPHADPFFQIPVFGVGWLLLVWAIVCVVFIVHSIRQHGGTEQVFGQLPMLLMVGAAIVWLAPMLEQQAADGTSLGLPIRGYGVMVMLGVISGLGLVVHLGSRMGVDPDAIFSLAFWVFIAGIVGARAFYVIEYWQEFSRPTIVRTLSEVLKFTQGGLVVYGGLIGAILAGTIFLRRHRLPLLAISDIVAPGLVLGLALGRIGCLLHGCCWGGTCTASHLGIEFPVGSPPYIDQLENGSLVGMQLVRGPDRGTLRVNQVVPGSPAAEQGFRVGGEIVGIEIPTQEQFRQHRQQPDKSAARVMYTARDLRRVSWNLNQLPPHSLSVYPTQILSSLNAALICWFLWSYYPFRIRDGAVLAWLLTIYPVTRILLEMIRTDEASVLDTSFKFTIGQAVSSILLLVAVTLWAYIFSRPRQLALPATTGGPSRDDRQTPP